MFDIPMAKGYCLIFGAMSMDGFLLFSGIEVQGYIAKAVEELRNK